MKAWAIAIVAFALVGCVSSPSAAPDLTGAWSFQVTTGPDAATHGAIALVAEGEGYSGTLTTDQGANTLVVRSMHLEGANLRMLVESPSGPVTFDGLLDPSGASFQGTVTYHTGQRFPMSGRRG